MQILLSTFLVPALISSVATSASHVEALAPTPSAVVGGTNAKPGEWPDVVAVFGEDGSLCSGTLIAPDVVLTAGHCIEGKPFKVVIDTVDLAQSAGESRDVKWSKAYAQWQTTYDVGVIMLDHPFSVRPSAFATSCTSRMVRGAKVTVVGFGLTTKTATDNNTRLHKAPLDVVDGTCAHDEACNTSIAPGGEFTAGGHGTDACFGDSGGPVYISTASGPALIGVVSRGLVSWGDPCGDGGVFVRADQVVKWIETVTARKLDAVACDVPADDGGDVDASDAASTETGGCNAGGESALGVVGLVLLMLALARLRRA